LPPFRPSLRLHDGPTCRLAISFAWSYRPEHERNSGSAAAISLRRHRSNLQCISGLGSRCLWVSSRSLGARYNGVGHTGSGRTYGLADNHLSLGYESESAFSKAFKRVIGCSPRQYSRGGNPASPPHSEAEAVRVNRLEPLEG
jgi:AraC-like DNA-binding protein